MSVDIILKYDMWSIVLRFEHRGLGRRRNTDVFKKKIKISTDVSKNYNYNYKIIGKIVKY